jgi:serine/threonine-protein kinase SRPK3
MLRLHPDKRGKAADLVHHNWLDGIVVQGEIDVIRRAEEMEKSRKNVLASDGTVASGSTNADDLPNGATMAGDSSEIVEVPSASMSSKGKKRLSGLTQSDLDAMKPVGEVEDDGDAIDEGIEEVPDERDEDLEQTSRQQQHLESLRHRQLPPILSAAPPSNQVKENSRPSGSGARRG